MVYVEQLEGQSKEIRALKLISDDFVLGSKVFLDFNSLEDKESKLVLTLLKKISDRADSVIIDNASDSILEEIGNKDLENIFLNQKEEESELSSEKTSALEAEVKELRNRVRMIESYLEVVKAKLDGGNHVATIPPSENKSQGVQTFGQPQPQVATKQVNEAPQIQGGGVQTFVAPKNFASSESTEVVQKQSSGVQTFTAPNAKNVSRETFSPAQEKNNATEDIAEVRTANDDISSTTSPDVKRKPRRKVLF